MIYITQYHEVKKHETVVHHVKVICDNMKQVDLYRNYLQNLTGNEINLVREEVCYFNNILKTN